jgi:hypothetical protein
MRIVNVPIRRLLLLPFKTPLNKRLMLLSFTGRKTGRAYRQPVSYVSDGDGLLTPGGGRWKLNLHEGEPIHVRLRGHDVLARPHFVQDVGVVEGLVRKMLVRNRLMTSFVPFVKPDGQIDRGMMECAIDNGFCIVRWSVEQVGA